MIARTGEKRSRDASACVLLSLLLLPSSIVGRSSEQEFRSTATAALDLGGRAEATTREETRRSRDSYLEALNHSRTSTDPREGVVAVDDPRGSASIRRGPVSATKRAEVLPGRTPERLHGVRNSYESAYTDYSPHGGYAAPGPYSTPQHQGYGPPVADYGLAHAMPQSVHLGIPSVDFAWPFALKLNAFTLAKIILKLVIFKMIVKFIAVVCLLLFIPKLEIKKGNKGSSGSGGGGDDDGDDDDDERSRSTNAESTAWNRLNRLTFLVDDALGRYRNANQSRPGSGDECRAPECRDPGTPDYENLLRGYLLEETRLLR